MSALTRAGEAYDKVARMLGLDLKPNGGAALEAIARQGNPNAYPFNIPMRKYSNCDFSYAGLKTSVRLCIERELGSAEGAGKRATRDDTSSSSSSSTGGGSSTGNQQPFASSPLQQQDLNQQQQQQGMASQSGTSADLQQQDTSEQQQQQQHNDPQQQQDDAQQQQQQQQIKADVAASFQRVAVAHLVMRLKRAIEWARDEEPSLQHLVVAGGVASNQYVRQQVTQVRVSTCVE
jgi:tRNA A37 threonylcarbamoyltransferase TsaD